MQKKLSAFFVERIKFVDFYGWMHLGRTDNWSTSTKVYEIYYNKFESECKEFEKKYKMDSEFFLNKFDSGELGDDLQWFDWYASIRGKKLWGKKYQILSEISWNE